MIKVDVSDLQGKYALSRTYPHYGVWKIHEISIKAGYSGSVVAVRGEETPWLSLTNCHVCDKEELEEALAMIEHRRKIESLSFQYDTLPPELKC